MDKLHIFDVVCKEQQVLQISSIKKEVFVPADYSDQFVDNALFLGEDDIKELYCLLLSLIFKFSEEVLILDWLLIGLFSPPNILRVFCNRMK